MGTAEVERDWSVRARRATWLSFRSVDTGGILNGDGNTSGRYVRARDSGLFFCWLYTEGIINICYSTYSERAAPFHPHHRQRGGPWIHYHPVCTCTVRRTGPSNRSAPRSTLNNGIGSCLCPRCWWLILPLPSRDLSIFLPLGCVSTEAATSNFATTLHESWKNRYSLAEYFVKLRRVTGVNKCCFEIETKSKYSPDYFYRFSTLLES